MSSPPAADLYAPGTLVGGKYRLERKLGEGGMGAVWSAHHAQLDTAVAIKLIRGEANRKDMALRLMQEARAAAKLGHPAIVRVFDVGETDQGDPFIVMEQLEGESLQDRLIREHRLSATDAAQLLLPIADALRTAHAKGIVHRDIKPDNVFLSSDAASGDSASIQPKLVDFGIAKLQQRDVSSQLTQKGVVLGSPDYMSPEQARGEDDIDHRSDIWGFCVLFYEVVSGQPPFEGSNYNALLRSIVETRPSSLEELCATDSELSKIIETGMAKDRGARWQSMQLLGEAIASWLVRQGVFEDVAGGSVEAKWILRRTDPALRQSRPSITTLPGVVRSGPGAATERRRAAEAPTTAGPVVTGTGQRRRLRFLVPGGVALALLVMAFALWPKSSVPKPAPLPAPEVAPVAPAAALPAAAPEDVRPSPQVKPLEQPVAPAPASAHPVEMKPGRGRGRAPASVPSARRAAKPGSGLDLISPY
jgi:serine/threonine-protein kinase